MSKSIEELADLEEKILKEIPDSITAILTRLNRKGQLDDFLEMIGMNEEREEADEFRSYKDGIILVIGGTEVKEESITGIAKGLGLSKDRFEFCLDYDEIQKYDFGKLQYTSKYRVVLFGPAPHSGYGKKDSGSILAEIESGDGYPRVERLVSGNDLKITKTNIKEKLKQLIDEDYI